MTDREGFDDFAATRSERLLRAAYLLTRDWALAEDLLQTTLTKVWLAWSRVEHDVDAYTHQTMVHLYASWWRRKWRGEVPTEDLPDSPDPAASHEHGALTHDLWQAMGRLPRRQRAVIVLRYFLDLSEHQTALALDCSPGTVKSQTSKALAKLRIDPSLVPEETTTGGQPS